MERQCKPLPGEQISVMFLMSLPFANTCRRMYTFTSGAGNTAACHAFGSPIGFANFGEGGDGTPLHFSVGGGTSVSTSVPNLYFGSGYIAEVLMWNYALSWLQQQAAECYLAERYSTCNNLPPGHLCALVNRPPPPPTIGALPLTPDAIASLWVWLKPTHSPRGPLVGLAQRSSGIRFCFEPRSRHR